MPYGLGASLPTATAITPSHSSARLVSIPLMRACGYGECKIFPISIPATLRSSVYLPAPVVFPAASIIAVDLPIMEKSLIAVVVSRDCPLGCNRRAYGLVHLAIAGTATKIAAEGGADISLRR